MLSESIFFGNRVKAMCLILITINNIYLPNKDNVELDVFPEEGCLMPIML